VGNDLIVGNANPSTLKGGTGRNILIGGGGQATLDASRGTSDNILIGGRTDWDMNLAALEAIMAEWDRPDLSFADRRSDLLNGTNSQGKAPLNTIIVNGVKQLVLLTPSTNRTSSNGKVHANAYIDTLIGGTAIDPATGKRVHNWFLYALNDVIENYSSFSDKKNRMT
jgi:Ca2+-binding RTX toxin-like protein